MIRRSSEITTKERQRLKVLLLVNGFPTEDSPSRGVFNLRAAKSLKPLVDLKVLQIRYWRPGRKIFSIVPIDDIERGILTVPVIPPIGYTPLDHSTYALGLRTFRFFGSRILKQWLAECDIIHSVGAQESSVIGSYWAKCSGKHHVAQAIGTDVNSDFKFMHRWSTVIGWDKWVQGVSCNSAALATEFFKYYPNVPNVRAIYRGVDVEQFRPDGDKWGPLAQIDHPTRYLYLGGLPSYNPEFGANMKGGVNLMDAWKQAESDDRTKQTTLLFAGPKADCEQSRQWHLTLKHPERVFITNSIHPSNLSKLYRSVDVVIVPSMAEGTPNVALEASSSGCAVIGSDAGGTPEIVEHGKTGLIYPRGDAIQLREILLAYSDNFDAISQMGKAARDRMVQHFNKDNFARMILELYYDAMKLPLPVK